MQDKGFEPGVSLCEKARGQVLRVPGRGGARARGARLWGGHSPTSAGTSPSLTLALAAISGEISLGRTLTPK